MATAKVPATASAVDETVEEDAKNDKMSIEYMRQHFAKQDRVSIKCAEDQWVQINNYTFAIKKGERVMVPQDVFDILDQAGRI
jgi:alanine racemase